MKAKKKPKTQLDKNDYTARYEQGKKAYEQLTELEKYLISTKIGPDLRRWGDNLFDADSERPLLLTAHAIVEKLLGDMITTRLSHPDVWLNEADFRSRTNLVMALGLISDREFNICRVLNSARNSAAHGMGPLQEKWRIEIMRLAFGQNASSRATEPSALQDALYELIISVSAPWIYTKVDSEKKNILEEHSEKFKKLIIERLKQYPNYKKVFQDDKEMITLKKEVEDELARELRKIESL
ncbi:MAG: hypothetical protein P4L42_13445 [Desulfocapsaceae bacterium]|nr:hypothetical protein [Desulfocapsaceae bacterium]